MQQNNIQRLGDTLSRRMVRSANAAIPTTVELGTINSDLSLTTDGLGGKIPPSDYMIDLRLTHDTYLTSEETHQHEGGKHHQFSGDGYHTHNDGIHSHRLPSVFRRPKAGDRVLVIWVGHEPIIVAIVVSGTSTQD